MEGNPWRSVLGDGGSAGDNDSSTGDLDSDPCRSESDPIVMSFYTLRSSCIVSFGWLV